MPPRVQPAPPPGDVPPGDPALQQQEARSATGATGKDQKAARVETDAIDRLADQTEALAAPAGDALVDTIRELVTRADTIEEVRDGLTALRPDMPADGLARAMQLALAYAELSGRAEIADA